MKAARTLGVLVVGMGIGWMLKPSSGSAGSGADSASGKSKSRPAAVEGATGHGESVTEGRETPAGKSHERSAKEPVKGAAPVELDEMAKKMMAAMDEQRTKRSEERIAKLVERLGLNASQEARLREFFKKKDAGTDVSVGEGGGTFRMASHSEGPSLDDFMKDLLTDPQKASYEDLKEAETNQRVEARALREMASLTQAVELREDQREAVYGILQDQARQEAAGGAVDGITGGLGFLSNVDMAAGDGVISGVSSFEIRAPEGEPAPDTAEVIKQARDQQQARIDEKVNRLSGILDAGQLAQYRSRLSQGFLLPGP